MKKSSARDSSRACPVCKMSAGDLSPHRNYRGADYWFCSDRCKKRFDSRPHLYVGDPWHGQSVKQKGEEVVKSHRINLNIAPSPLVSDLLVRELEQLMGVKSVRLQGQAIEITYDLIQISFADIENAIETAYGGLKSGMVESVRRGLIRNSEDCELDNLEHLPPKNPWNPRS